jgi:4'-phosphopantetheinyl transferase
MDSAPAIQFYNTSGTPSPERVALLSGIEQARAARFHFEHDRHRWINGRAWVKQQLATHLKVQASALHFSATAHGRPFLPDSPEIDFNLSHSGEWIALAIGPGNGRIGLDIETIDPTFPTHGIAREFFLPEECSWLSQGPIERFYQLWTAKEALMKATGQGMSLPPDQIRVSLQDDHPVAVTNLQSGTTHPVLSYSGPGNTIVATVHLPDYIGIFPS